MSLNNLTKKRKNYTFNMPDGSILYTCAQAEIL